MYQLIGTTDTFSKRPLLPAWEDLFDKHDVTLLATLDADKPEDIELEGAGNIKEVMGENIDLVYSRNTGHKLIAFYHIAKNLHRTLNTSFVWMMT